MANQTVPANPYEPAIWEAHQKRVAEIRAELDKHKPELRRCLNPEYAAQCEGRKPLFEFEVKATIMRPNAKGRLEEKTEKHKIIAQNEGDAWAFFCDKIEEWPSRHNADMAIKQLSKIN